MSECFRLSYSFGNVCLSIYNDGNVYKVEEPKLNKVECYRQQQELGVYSICMYNLIVYVCTRLGALYAIYAPSPVADNACSVLLAVQGLIKPPAAASSRPSAVRCPVVNSEVVYASSLSAWSPRLFLSLSTWRILCIEGHEGGSGRCAYGSTMAFAWCDLQHRHLSQNHLVLTIYKCDPGESVLRSRDILQ